MNVSERFTAVATNPPARLLAQADLVLLVCHLLRPPNASRIAHLSAAREVLDELLATAGCADPETAGALADAIDAAGTTTFESWCDEYRRLFDGTTLCPLNQTAYVRRDKGAVIGDVCGFYRAFGFDVSRSSGEKPDHLVTELEFVAALLAMLAGADGDEGKAELTRQALSTFTSAHLSDWVSIVTDRLARITELPLYVAAARATQAAWSALALEHGFELPAVVDLEAAANELQQEPESPYECGMAPSDAPAENVELHVRGRTVGT